jgi:hypothetical protein
MMSPLKATGIGGVIMDSYIIRIYRRDDRNPANIAGLVEIVESDETRPFVSYEELMGMLKRLLVQSSGKARRTVQSSRNNNKEG